MNTVVVFSVVLLIFGIGYSIYGALLLGNKKFLYELMNTVWKMKSTEYWTEEKQVTYNKYGRGLAALFLGIGSIIIGVYGLL